jgi:7-cyano-7-deazaguanine reductase
MNGNMLLGRQVDLPASPREAELQTVMAPSDNTEHLTLMPGEEHETHTTHAVYVPRYIVRFSCPEFTSLCPVTGQPDFAHIVIDYMPKSKLVESKSLKLFLGSFRNHGDYHEACTNYIGQRILAEVEPFWIRVAGFWYPRGGIPIDILWEAGTLIRGCLPLPLNVPSYRGR